MRKRRFNHIEPREKGEGASAPEARSFRRTLERGLRFPAMLKALVFRRRIEIRGRERGPDDVEVEVEELVQAVPEKRPDPATEPSKLEIEEPAKTDQDPPRFSKTKSQLEKLAAEIKDFEPPVQARKTAGHLKREEMERLRKREAEIADLVHKENQPGPPSVASGMGKILLGGVLALIFLMPVVLAVFPGLFASIGSVFRWIGGDGAEGLFYLLGLLAFVFVTATGRNYRRRR